MPKFIVIEGEVQTLRVLSQMDGGGLRLYRFLLLSEAEVGIEHRPSPYEGNANFGDEIVLIASE
jgi:hypothetical protein